MMSAMDITVIIPCFNEENYVGSILADIARQTLVPSSVVIVDCHSTDKTVQVAEKFSARLPLRILQSDYKSAAAARNIGAASTVTDYLLFLDADIRIPPDFLKQICARAATRKADFVSPRFKAENHHPVDVAMAWYINAWIGLYHMLLRRHVMGIGGAMLIRKSRHDTVGGYRSELREFDDIDYCTRLNAYKIPHAFAWKAVAVTSSRRYIAQGRLATVVQALPDNHYLVRKLIRPIMNKLGIRPKWHDM
jgi:glycosyltransferase involved in cell wall biosynthesis